MANSLSKLAFGGTIIQDVQFLEKALYSVLDNRAEVFNIQGQVTWMTPFQNFLKEGILLEDEGESTRIRRLSESYLIINGELYRRRYSTPYLRCTSRPETERVLREAHEGVAACHEGARTLTQKIFRLGYYWSTLGKDTAELT